MNTFQMQDFQKFGQVNSETAVKMMGDWTKNWQAITTELTDYSKRAFQDGVVKNSPAEVAMTKNSLGQVGFNEFHILQFAILEMGALDF